MAGFGGALTHSPRRLKAHAAMLAYENRLLPHLSLPALFGAALFFLYCGSAALSLLSPGTGGAPVTFDHARDKQKCAALRGVAEASCHWTNSTRTLYMAPYGGLGSRLRGTASALTLAKQLGVNVVIVWVDQEFGFTGAWRDLFAQPDLPLGCFPGQTMRPALAACKVHTINHVDAWEKVKAAGWERVKGGGGTREVLCMRSVMYLTPKQREIGWFYRGLVPAESIMQRVEAFMREVRWQEWGVWVGVHARRTDLMLKCNTADCSDGVSVQDALPLSAYTDLMRQVTALAGTAAGAIPRFYLATDDPGAEEQLRKKLTPQLAARLGGNVSWGGAGVMPGGLDPSQLVVSFKKEVRDTSADWLAMRSVTSGVQEAIADMFLLSRARMLLGTVGSTFSQTAKLMGKPFFITVGVQFENRM